MTFVVLISTEKCHFPTDMQSLDLTMNYLLLSNYLLSVKFLNNTLTLSTIFDFSFRHFVRFIPVPRKMNLLHFLNEPACLFHTRR